MRFTQDLTPVQGSAAISQAFETWAAVTPLSFKEVPPPLTTLGLRQAMSLLPSSFHGRIVREFVQVLHVNILIGFLFGDHGDPDVFDGAGDVHFNDAAGWIASTSAATSGSARPHLRGCGPVIRGPTATPRPQRCPRVAAAPDGGGVPDRIRTCGTGLGKMDQYTGHPGLAGAIARYRASNPSHFGPHSARRSFPGGFVAIVGAPVRLIASDPTLRASLRSGQHDEVRGRVTDDGKRCKVLGYAPGQAHGSPYLGRIPSDLAGRRHAGLLLVSEDTGVRLGLVSTTPYGGSDG